jgi:hypothetical protein
MMASNDIVEPELDSWLWSMLAMDMVHKMWTVAATIARASVASSVGEAKGGIQSRTGWRKARLSATYRARL